MALSLVLLTSAGLLLKSLHAAQRLDLGFDSRGVLLGSLDLFGAGYDEAKGRAFARSLLAAAYAGEQRRYGKGLDRHLTKIYNQFAYQPSPAKFCSDAAAVAEEAGRMDSAALSNQARRLLGRL